MSHNSQTSRRWVLAVAAVAVTMAVVAAPSAAKGPMPPPVSCPPSEARASVPEPVRAACDPRWAAQQTTGDRSGSGGSNPAIVAGIMAFLVLVIAAGLHVATHRRDAQGRRASALSGPTT
jgi:hypothetical protein